MAQGLGENLAINIGVNVTGLPQVQQVQTRMRGLNKTIQRSTSQYSANAVATNKWAKGALQQAGYQVGDLAVQVTGGTNAIQAFGQQGSQLLGIFGPVGAVLGAALAIASAVGVTFSKMGGEVKSAEEAFASLIDRLKQLNSLESKTQKLNRIMQEGFRTSTDEVRTLVNALIEAERVKVLSTLADGFRGVAVDIAGASDELSQLEGRRTGLQAQLDLLEEGNARYRQTADLITDIDKQINALGGSTQEFNNLFNQILTLSRETDPQKLVEGLASARANALEIGGPIGRQIVQTVDTAAASAGVLDFVLSNAEGSASGLKDEIAELGTTALSAAEAMLLIQKGVLPPQAREDLGIIDSTYEVIRKLNQEMAETGDEILDSAKGASDLANELQRAANAVMNINISAFSRLGGLQAEVRGRTRGLGDEQIRIMQAAMSAELAAKERGVEDAPELAAIASEAASIERQIIAAESALSLFGKTGSGAMSNVANATQGALGIMEGMFDELDAIVENVSKTIEGSLTSGFMSMIDGTKTVKDAFSDMARAIIADLYEVLVVQRLVGSVKEGTGIAGAIGTALGFRASGGQVTGNKPYIVGERGPEMVVPSRNAHVVPNNKMGGGGGPVQVVYQFQGGVTEADLGRALPLLVERTKREVVDAVQRGGSVARVFR